MSAEGTCSAGAALRRWRSAPPPRFGGGGALHGLHRGLIEIVLRFDTGPGNFGNGDRAGELLVLQVEIGGQGLIGVAVDGVDDQLPVVDRGGNVQVGHIVETGSLVPGAVDEQLQGFAFDVVGEQGQGIVNGLQENALVVAENGSDDVDQLRHVGDFDDVGVVDEGVEEGGDDQRILEVVVLFQDAAAALLVAAGAVPDIPFIPGDVDFAVAGLSGEGGIDDALGGFGALVEFHGTGHEVAEIVAAVAHVEVQREIVGVLAEGFEHGAVPGGPIAAGAEVGTAGGDQLDARDRKSTRLNSS